MATEMAAPPEMMEESSEIISAPVSALGGAVVGDTVTLTVDAIDGDMATLALSESAEKTQPKGSTISEAAKLFDEGGE